MILRLLGPAGIAGLVASVALGLLLLVAKGETRHWKKQSGQYEQLYAGERTALALTVANYRAATEVARAADRANAERVATEQRGINQRTAYAYQARIADARARYASTVERMHQDSPATADSGTGRTAPVPGLPASAGGAPKAAREDGLSPGDALVATEQAIQLDELIGWVRRQATVDPNGSSGVESRGAKR